MAVSRERARSLLADSIPLGEPLLLATVARFPTSLALTFLVLVGMPGVLIGTFVAVGVTRPNPVAIIGIIGGILPVVALGLWLLRRSERRCVVGLTPNRLLVGLLADHTGLRVAEVWEYPRATLPARVKSRFLNTGAAGTVLQDTGRIEITDPKHPVRLDFPPSLMADNTEVYRQIRDALAAP
jgi:hypothetical protein